MFLFSETLTVTVTVEVFLQGLQFVPHVEDAMSFPVRISSSKYQHDVQVLRLSFFLCVVLFYNDGDVVILSSVIATSTSSSIATVFKKKGIE